jgi:hypothetical protein
LKSKFPQASISTTYKFALLKYLIERQEIEEAKKLATEFLKEIGPDISLAMLLNFAELAKKLSPPIAKKTIELCLNHPEIPMDKKERLKDDLKDIGGGTEAPAEY